MTIEQKKKCFVIMPFSKTTDLHTEEYWTNHYSEFLKPLIESHPLEAYRSSPLRGDVLRQIITDLVISPIVVADLTDLNPNVLWELGVRQSFRHCTITISDDAGKRLPFDLGVKGTLYYSGNHIKIRQFEKDFSNAMTDCLNNPNFPDSHVLETIGGRGTLFQILMKQESIRKLEALITEIDSNLELFERIAKICASNAEHRKSNSKTSFPVRNYRIMAAESLWVNRYVETKSSFYQILDSYISHALSHNEAISHWIQSKDTEQRVEDWVSRNNETFYKDITKLKEIVLNEKDKIISIN